MTSRRNFLTKITSLAVAPLALPVLPELEVQASQTQKVNSNLLIQVQKLNTRFNKYPLETQQLVLICVEETNRFFAERTKQELLTNEEAQIIYHLIWAANSESDNSDSEYIEAVAKIYGINLD